MDYQPENAQHLLFVMRNDPAEVEKWLQAQKTVVEQKPIFEIAKLPTKDLEDNIYIIDQDAKANTSNTPLQFEKDPLKYLRTFNGIIKQSNVSGLSIQQFSRFKIPKYFVARSQPKIDFSDSLNHSRESFKRQDSFLKEHDIRVQIICSKLKRHVNNLHLHRRWVTENDVEQKHSRKPQKMGNSRALVKKMSETMNQLSNLQSRSLKKLPQHKESFQAPNPMIASQQRKSQKLNFGRKSGTVNDLDNLQTRDIQSKPLDTLKLILSSKHQQQSIYLSRYKQIIQNRQERTIFNYESYSKINYEFPKHVFDVSRSLKTSVGKYHLLLSQAD